MCGLDEFGVTGIRGVNGFAAGLSTNFLTTADLSDDVESFMVLLVLLVLIVPVLVLLFAFELAVVEVTEGDVLFDGVLGRQST